MSVNYFKLSMLGEMLIPSSKSYAQRVIMLSVLVRRVVVLRGLDICNDVLSAIYLARDLGCFVEYDENTKKLKIDSRNVTFNSKKLFVGESGFLARFCLSFATCFSGSVEINGSGSLLDRSFQDDLNNLSRLGVDYDSVNGKLPIVINSKIRNFKTTLDCKDSSQFLSGLLMTGSFLDNNLELSVSNLVSCQYVDMTIETLSEFGLTVFRDEYKYFQPQGGELRENIDYLVPGDYSSASCMLVAGAIFGNNMVFKNLTRDSIQPDAAILKVLIEVGAKVDIFDDRVVITRDRLESFDFDATNCPDLIPALVALAANVAGVSSIKGAERLINKESNRMEALEKEYLKLNIDVYCEDGIIYVIGFPIDGGIELDCHNDHRIAMSLAVASLNAEKENVIIGMDCVDKSYKSFWEDLRSVLHTNN